MQVTVAATPNGIVAAQLDVRLPGADKGIVDVMQMTVLALAAWQRSRCTASQLRPCAQGFHHIKGRQPRAAGGLPLEVLDEALAAAYAACQQQHAALRAVQAAARVRAAHSLPCSLWLAVPETVAEQQAGVVGHISMAVLGQVLIATPTDTQQPGCCRQGMQCCMSEGKLVLVLQALSQGGIASVPRSAPNPGEGPIADG